MSVIALSGGFDPFHFGHLRMIQSAAEYGDVIILLNSDAWLERKKGYAFMPYAQRAAILNELYSVHTVLPAQDDDGTVCSSLADLRPGYFGNGGDRVEGNVPEEVLCRELGIGLVYGLGGGKIASSSELVRMTWDKIGVVGEHE